MDKILLYLDGKKAVILGIAGVVIGYLVTSGQITGDVGTLILSIINILGGGAAIGTNLRAQKDPVFGGDIRNKRCK